VTWQLDDGKPKIVYGADHLDKLIHVYRLGDVAVDVQIIAPQDVLLSAGGG
jgi:hypothetical protein